MIMRFLKKIPAGMMVVPMLLGAIINTFLPEVTNIGSFTTAVFTSAGANTAIGIQLFCLGTTLRVRDMGGVVKRGGVLLISKFVIGAAIGIVVGKVFGPTGVLGLSSLATVSRLMRTSMLDVLSSDYIKTAKSKGLSQGKILWRHALRNAIMPVVTIMGPTVASVLTGTFVIESIFNIPGLGKYFVTSIKDLDYTMIGGTVVFYGGLLIVCTLVVDLLYGFIDPRVKLEE